GQRALAASRLRHQRRQAGDAAGRADQRRVPARGAVVAATSHAVHQESQDVGHRGEPAYCRSRAIPQAGRRFRLRPHGSAIQFFEHAGRLVAELFFRAGRRDAGLAEPRRYFRSGHRCAHRQVIAADSRTSLTTACRVLDRVIRSGRYWVPHWYKASHWLAYWDVFGRPGTKPRYARGIPETWWYDQEKAAKIDQ